MNGEHEENEFASVAKAQPLIDVLEVCADGSGADLELGGYLIDVEIVEYVASNVCLAAREA